MATPVRARDGQIVDAEPTTKTENQGSYPAEITAEHLTWLEQRAEARRAEWKAHTQSLVHNQKS